MTVMILERVSPSLRGDLSRWLIEVKAGVFIGRVSAIVREALWNRCVEQADGGTVMQFWTTNNEQGFDLLCYNPKRRRPVRLEGIWLMQMRHLDDQEPEIGASDT